MLQGRALLGVEETAVTIAKTGLVVLGGNLFVVSRLLTFMRSNTGMDAFLGIQRMRLDEIKT